MNGSADWVAAQRQLWRLWQSMLTGAGGGNDRPAFGPEGFTAFWQPFIKSMNPAGPADVFTDLFSPWVGARSEQAAAQGISRWLNQMLEGFQRAAADSAGVGTPADFINRFLQAPLAGFGSVGPDPDPFGIAGWMNMKPSEFAGLFDLPPLGLTREWEEKWRELQRAAKAEFEATQALGRQNARIYYEALKKFSRAVRGDDTAGADITSLRGLYDLWVDIAEGAYRDRVMTTEYAQVFGEQINSSARSRKAWQTLVSDYQEALNLPNRREIDSLIEQQTALAARIRELEQDRSAFDIDALVARVTALDTRLDALSERTPESPKPAAKRRNAKRTAKKVSPATRLDSDAPSTSPPETAKPAPERKQAKRRPKRASPAVELPARRLGPAKAETKRPKKRAAAKRRSADPAAEFDIGNLGSVS